MGSRLLMENSILYPTLTKEAYIHDGELFHIFRIQENEIDSYRPEPHQNIGRNLNIGKKHFLTFFETYRLELSLVSPIIDIKDFTCKELVTERKQLIQKITTIDNRLSQNKCQMDELK